MPKQQPFPRPVTTTISMQQHIDHIKHSKATGEEAAAALDESVKALLLMAMEEMVKQHSKFS